MKFTIQNFKSIRQVNEYQLKPITVLSGTNSSGKSSFAQFLLLLKQTIEKSSTDDVLTLSGKYININEFEDIIYSKDLKNIITFEILFEPNEVELESYLIGERTSKVSVSFCTLNSQILVSKFLIEISKSEDDTAKHFDITLNLEKLKYEINTNVEIFGKNLIGRKIISKIEFSSFFPMTWNFMNQDSEEENGIFTISRFKDFVKDFFNSFNYIAPLRENPKYEYSIKNKSENVGVRGQNAAFILAELANNEYEYYKVIQNENGIEYLKKTGSLLEAVNYWLCNYFQLGKKIYAEEKEETYRINIIDENDLIINIRHVGFGISQLLPIIIQGLIQNSNSFLLIEQPEIHLHPIVQSKLYDFLYSLTLSDKYIIVETHSSHFITRMRRRIAEDLSNEMDDRINLTFVENGGFRSLEIDDYGTLMNYHPENFIEESQNEMKAIINAQMKKRKLNNGAGRT